MKFADVTFNAPGDAPPGMPTTFPLKGFRIVPLGCASISEVATAYADLEVEVLRSSNARSLSGEPIAITDAISIVGPDWIRSPGFSSLTFTNAEVGRTYRVWWAEDCYEVTDPGTAPYLTGFTVPAAPPTPTPNAGQAVVGPAGAGTQAQSSTANIPSLSTDGLVLPSGARGAYATVRAPAAQTVTACTLVWWRWNNYISAWVETAVQEVTATGRRHVMGVEQGIETAFPGDRLFVEARNATMSGAGAFEVFINAAS